MSAYIHILVGSGKVHSILISDFTSTSIASLKGGLVESAIASDAKGIRLIFAGKVLGDDSKTLAEYKVRADSLLLIAFMTNGGQL